MTARCDNPDCRLRAARIPHRPGEGCVVGSDVAHRLLGGAAVGRFLRRLTPPPTDLRGREVSQEQAALDRATQGLSVARMMTARHIEPATWLLDGEPDALVVLCEVDTVLTEAIRDVVDLWVGR